MVKRTRRQPVPGQAIRRRWPGLRGHSRAKVEELHELVNKVSGNELGVIQVLGFLLGAFAGGLMARMFVVTAR
ncbi:MAG: hypothetical protein NZ899_04380 [Thermoguttaceae bacterium]|nr:hypothetical protein [Thermoguttaceae bacterium]MDW8077628.1 hypothetical protein [Thermoguttaceae bacterium]